MQFHAIATDYDGTLAHHGLVDDDTVASLVRLKKSGRKLMLVTGRVLPELLAVCSCLDLFELAVIENGAVVYSPALKATRTLATAPPPHFAAELAARGVTPVSTGQVIVATFEPHHDTVSETIRDLGLALEVILNKDAIMVLPRGVSKATGLAAALAELGLDPASVVGVGDAENDHAMLDMCGYGVAVANALPALKDSADYVTAGAHGEGVAELIDQLLSGTLEDPRRK